ncbi:MAG: TonB-dependent receptor plug domain-containing protein, partial [Cyanobacteria bacterium P01_H01_bin.153]
MTAKRIIGHDWSVQLRIGLWLLVGQAIAASAIKPALAETTPLPEGDSASVASTSAAALLPELETETAPLNFEAELNTATAPSATTQATVAATVMPYSQVTAVMDSLAETSPVVETAISSAIAQAQPVAITNIQIEETADGFSLRLEADDDLAVPVISVVGNAAIADIPNAVLQLPDVEEFLASNPAAGIALIDVVNLPDNVVRIAVTGTDAPPVVNISIGEVSLTVVGMPGDPTVVVPDDEAIQVLVTGDQIDDDYFVPDASTATRTDTPLLDTPQSIQVVPQQVLQDQQILRVDDALRNVSGLEGRVDTFGAGTNLTIRGFTAGSSNNDGAILRDGFRVPVNLSRQETANIERIEVIKGPSSVLYGLNDPGGLINLVTKRPLSEPFYDLEIQAGSFGLIRPSLDLTGPLTEDGRLTYRLNAAYQHEDGFRDFETETNSFFIAPIISWDIGDRTNFTVLLEYLNEEIPLDTNLPV